MKHVVRELPVGGGGSNISTDDYEPLKEEDWPIINKV